MQVLSDHLANFCWKFIFRPWCWFL